MFLYQTRDVVIAEDMIHSVAAPICSFTSVWCLEI